MLFDLPVGSANGMSIRQIYLKTTVIEYFLGAFQSARGYAGLTVVFRSGGGVERRMSLIRATLAHREPC